ncbi:MAG: tetratricopeptide repeat protein [Pirellulaceae bacterium]|nr:tetratricopeptide repeat protein [Pirellulaceae bacterium]
MVSRRWLEVVVVWWSLLGAAAFGDEALDDLLTKATRAAQQADHAGAIAHLTAAIKLQPTAAIAYYLRGREHFRAGKVAESVADFDRYVQLDPKSESQQWERGISYYYAGEFAKGAKQFELYQTFHDQDVENSTWRYLCVARTDGVEKAQANMLPIDNDPRIPMMQIFDLYRGKLQPADVLKAAEAGSPTKENLNTRLFYAHLYLGLWHEAAGRADEAKKHILEAEQHKIGHYMWDVAHVHAERLRK